MSSAMRYSRMPIEVESPEELGYGNIRFNLSESSIADQSLSDFGLTVPDDLILLYGEHQGSPGLRELIAADGERLTADDILICGGAAGALFIVATALLGKDDHLVVVRPNYATNLETPRAIGCEISFVDLSFDDGFALDPERIAEAVKPHTKLVSITAPHNPTGTSISEGELRRIVEITAEREVLLLVDETYRELTFETPLPVAASLGRHVISVSSLSKAFGAPGLRVGWIISTDAALQTLFLAAKEQISICGSVINEWVAEGILRQKADFLMRTRGEWRRRLDRITQWISGEDLLDWVGPAGGVVCFPRMTVEPSGGADAFYRRLLQDHGTYVGPGHWFEMPDTHFRLGYAWPTMEELEGGLNGISAALRG
jgi:aspartate/methionine/tyrosine aminotransferase